MMEYPNPVDIVVIIWFALSVIIAVFGTFVFWIWLRRSGIKLFFGLIGTPGYLEYAYLKWCRAQHISPKRGILFVRVLSIINVIIAGISFIMRIARP